ncbi:type I DNA topoisomerase [Pseudomonas corrugata]|uniref:DNA topoisomerase n=1 Tax=Pseudomonas corrugata TaxID=47879 RepID=UPI0018E5FF8C|nr:DNA topoisomerase [Pseudomonas corrugata]MBI6621560.1 type I DNA topoisomerase [Pseudomonas corrugata]MBI6694205.1 type I DNA topoisomerase [Pseudomonas corrugata]
MGYNLMVVESPGKTETITEIISKLRPGERWEVKACYGHFRDLPASEQAEGEVVSGISAGNYALRYELTERGAPVISRLAKLARDADHVYLASDHDREGEAIAWHLYEELELKDNKYSRIVFSTIDVDGIRGALSNPHKIDFQLVEAQEGRRALDRIVGYLISSELRRQSGENLSAGRVQSVAVLLVVLRELQRQKFKPTTHYSACLNFVESDGSEWTADWLNKPDFVNDANPYLTDRNFVQPLTGIKSMQVVSFEESEKKRNPPPPFITTTLQQAASNALGFSSKKTMDIAQQLFDAGKISYHRTDNPNVAEGAMPAIQAALAAKGLRSVDKRRAYKGKADAQEAHPGVTPVYWDLETAGETQEQQALYALIRNRALASQAESAVYKVREVLLRHPTAQLNGKAIHFGARGRVLVSPGFLRLLASDDTQDDQDEEAPNPIPELAPQAFVQPVNGELIEMTTKAPARYTEATLVGELERNGIGRPSTYAAIITNITDKNYILPDLEDKSRKGKAPFFYPTPTGIRLISMMAGKFSFLDINFTRELEKDLDSIAKGMKEYTDVVGGLYNTVNQEIERQKAAVPSFVKAVVVYNCECGKPLRLIQKKFWGCTGHPECDKTYPDNNGSPGKARPKTEVSDAHKCGACGAGLVHRVKKGAKNGYNFWACSAYAKTGCKQSYKNVKGEDRPNYNAGSNK